MMSRKKILALLALGVSFVVLDANVGTARAAADKTFSPAGAWSVNRVDPPNGGTPYCTLARRFNGNMIITFARNTDGEGTVAIDFQQPLFEPSQTYRVALQAGYGLKREFLTRPATMNALVLRTGQDPQFFSALSGSSDMTVIFDNGRYAFSMPDFSTGEAKLSGCIGDSPAVMPRTPAADTDNAALSQLRSEIDALKRENASIAASLRDGDTQTTTDRTAGMSNSAENEALLAKLAALESERNLLVDRLQTERSRQQQEAQDEVTLRQALEDQKSLRQMLDNERQQRSELESALVEKTAEAEKRGELRARIEQLEASNTQLKALRETLETERGKRLMVEEQLKEQKAKSAATLEDQERLRTRVTELESENASLQQTAEQSASQFETTRIKLQSTQSRMDEELARREAAERALKEVQMTASEKEARIASMQGQIEAERRKLEEAQAQQRNSIAQLQTQMDAERRRLEEAEVEKQTALAKAHTEELGRLNAELEKLRDVSIQKEEISQSFSAEQARRAAAEKELNAARAEKADVNSRLQEMSAKLAELESKNGALRDEVQAAKARTQETEKAMAQMKSSADAEKELNALREKDEADRRELRAMLEAEKARREKLEGIAAKGGDADAKLREIESQMGELAKRNDELEKALAEEKSKGDSAEVARADQLKKQLEAMKADNMMLAEKLARNAGVAASETPAQAVEKVVEKVVYQGDEQMAEALAETKSSLASALAERDEYRDLLQRERIEKDDGVKASSPSGQAAGLNAQVASLEAERVDLIRQLEYERSRNEQIAAGREAPPPSGKSEKDINARLKALESEKDKLKKQLDVAQRDVIDARTAANKGAGVPDADVAALLAENKKLQADLAASARNGKSSDVRALETEIASLRAQNNVLSEEINKRLSAAPEKAATDNALAAADYKARAANAGAKKLEERYAAVEAENMRLARELAQARNVAATVANANAKAGMAPIVDSQQQAAQVSEPVADAPARQTASAGPRAVPAQAAQPSSMFTPASIPADVGPSGRDIENWLRRAGISMASGLEKVRKVSNARFAAFRWDTGVVFGTAEQRVMANKSGFEQAINDYLSKTRDRCSGTFDQSFDPSQMSGRKTFAVADVACIMKDGQGAGAAVVFFYKDGLFNVIAHEGELAQFDQAMSTRDTLARFLSSQM